MADEIEEKILDSDEELDEIQEDIGFEDYEEDNSGELSWKQKLILINSGIFAFLFFIVLLFPYEEIARTFISKFAQENNIVLEFRKLNLSFFSTKTVDHLIYQNKDNMEIRAESVDIDTSIWDIMKKKFIGSVKITSLNLELGEYAIKANSVNLEDTSIIGLDRDLLSMNGTVNLQIYNGKIQRSPIIPMIDSLQGVAIKSIMLTLKKTLNSNRIIIEKGTFSLSIAKVILSGYIELSPVFKSSRIDLKICPTLTESYKTEREDIASSLQLLTQDLPDGCIPVQGTIGDPKVNLPGIQSPPNTSQPVLSPVPNPNSPAPPPPPQKEENTE